jgi:hypothetical protein
MILYKTSNTSHYILTVTETAPNVQLCHKRLGHIGGTKLYHMTKFQNVHGLPPINLRSYKLTMCSSCILGKQHRRTFRQNIVHMSNNVGLGKSSIHGFNGHFYVILFIDDFSNLSVVKSFNSRDNVL